MERWLVKMAMWVRNPPSPQRVKLVFSVIALCLAIFGFEWLFGWPDWLTPQKLRP